MSKTEIDSPFDRDDEEPEFYSEINVDTLPWIEKYRPKTLNDIVAHNNVISTLKIFLEKKTLPHTLFYGPPGTGKTSTIMACAKELYGEYHNFMVMELNASDDRGIEIVRNKIKQFVSGKNVFFKEKGEIFKLVILDETDAMTADAQAILRQVIEKFTETTRFCLICNYIQNISPALQSRCQKFRFAPLPKQEIVNKIKEVSKLEDIKVTSSGIETIVYRSSGDMRKVLNILQSVSMAYKTISEKTVNISLGYPRKAHIKDILIHLVEKDFVTCYEFIKGLLKDHGLSIADIMTEIHAELEHYVVTLDTDIECLKIKSLDMAKIIRILSELRFIEYNQSANTTENIQLVAIVGLFKTF